MNENSRASHLGEAPKTFTGNELRAKEFPPIKWAIPDILPAGVTLFGGREKMGKSWLAFSLCIAVATGGYALGKMRVEQGDALYLSLEDPERRLFKRIRRLSREETDLAHFHYTTEWQPADRGGVEHLYTWLEEHPQTRLVVIDTLKRIRPRTSGKRNMYDEDYEAVQPFVGLAAKHNTALVVLHHLNQLSEPHDPFDAFSGSAGLTAAAEHIWLLTRKRGDADAYLMVDGKDIEEPRELALGWDSVTCTWTAQGDAETYRLTRERREIVELLEREGEPMGPKEVAGALDRDYEPTRRMINRMAGAGQLKTAGYGKYVPAQGPSPTSPTSPTSTNGLSRTDRTSPLYETNAPESTLTDGKRHSPAAPGSAQEKMAKEEREASSKSSFPSLAVVESGASPGRTMSLVELGVRLTGDEVERIKELRRQGMSPAVARDEVLRKRGDRGGAA